MYLQPIDNILQSHEVKIKYDCDGGFERCGQEVVLKLKYAEKNFKNNGKHICRQCQLKIKNPMKKKEVQEKVKKTCLEKYGSLPLNSEANIQKRREQFQNTEFKEQWLEQHRETCLKKYGVGHHMKSNISKENQKKSMQEKYGVDCPYQSEEIMAKMKANNFKKYGVENVASLPEVQIKMAKTTLERYGIEHYNQLPEMQEYLRENCKEWLAESYKNPWNKGLARPEEWNQKQRETVTELMMMGIWKAGYPTSKKGFCYPEKCKKEKVYFRSSYEAIYCYWLDNNPDVDWFSFEAFRIPYEFGGKTRFYVPDFIVGWKNNKISIKELKAEFLRDDEMQKAKRDAGTIFANSNEMDYELLFNDFFDSLDITFDYLKEIRFIK